MQKKDKTESTETKTPPEIDEYYEKYKRKSENVLIFKQIYNTDFCFDEHYEIIDCIGQGAYGMVAAVRDRRNDQFYAMKKIQNPCYHSLVAKRTLRELRILRFLKHENVRFFRLSIFKIVENHNILLPKSRGEFRDIYILSELMETDLKSIIKSDQELKEIHIKFFVYQILRGLKYIHSAGILHRDLVKKIK